VNADSSSDLLMNVEDAGKRLLGEIEVGTLHEVRKSCRLGPSRGDGWLFAMPFTD
jgi:hypothetical protein